jgi:hypothetical protein
MLVPNPCLRWRCPNDRPHRRPAPGGRGPLTVRATGAAEAQHARSPLPHRRGHWGDRVWGTRCGSVVGGRRSARAPGGSVPGGLHALCYRLPGVGAWRPPTERTREADNLSVCVFSGRCWAGMRGASRLVMLVCDQRDECQTELPERGRAAWQGGYRPTRIAVPPRSVACLETLDE